MSQADAPAADWYPDPSGRFQFRYWDGESWTGHVSTDGETDWDPPEEGAGDSGGGQAAAEQSAVTADEPTSQDGAPGTDPATSAADEQQAAESGVTTDDSAFAPQAAAEPFGDQSADPQPADAVEPGGQSQPAEPAQPEPAQSEPAQPEQAQSEPAQPEPAQPDEALAEPAQAEGGTIEEGEPSDTNLVANQRAEVDDDVKGWLDQVAAQVEPRLSRINREWTVQPQAEAARACAYGLLVGHLAHLHPHMREDLSKVAESHPSFTTLEDGARLDTLEQIARDPQRTAAWLGPLIGTEDTDEVQTLFD